MIVVPGNNDNASYIARSNPLMLCERGFCGRWGDWMGLPDMN
jgi:hypothetical protein